ncbi:MAG TPA: threonine/serine dehydratase [Streptosporangiaceae bacterium]|nr:threonine/serine dehydratase [Streptosporangiaceae bacterium]
MADLVSIDEIRSAAGRLDGVVLRTPLVPFARVEPRLVVKAESLQPTGAFKLRGAYSAISALPAPQRSAGVVAHSSGNHAHAVAYAAALLNVQATVVVPANAPAVKVAAARALGARIVTCEPSLAARAAATDKLVAEHGYTPIPPFEHRDVIAGQGTIGLEIASDFPEVDLVVCPVGGGGLIAGIAAAIAAVSPGTKVVGVEPELAADARDSLRQGHRVAWASSDTQRTIADALRADQIGELPMRHVLKQVHDIVTVTEDEITEAMRLLATGARLVAEPAGAVAIAACLFRAAELPASSRRVAILSGGNVDPALLASVLCSAPAAGALAGDRGAPAAASGPPAVR